MKVADIQFEEVKQQFRQLFNYLLKKWWIILLVGVLGGVAGIVYSILTKPKYTANLTFALEESGGGLSGALSLAAEFGLSIGGGQNVFAGDNILMIVSSRRMLESVLLSVDSGAMPKTYIQEWLEINELKKSWKNYPRLSGIDFPANQKRETFSYLQDSILYVCYKQIVKSNLVAQRPDKKLNNYQLTFWSHDEGYSKRFIEKLLDETTTFYYDLKSTRSRNTLQILEGRVAELKGSVNTAITSRTTAQDVNLNPAFARAQIPLQKSQVDMTMYGAALTELYKNLELARYQYLKDVPLLQVIDAPHFPLEYSRPRKLFSAIIGAFIFGILIVLYFTFFGFNKMKESGKQAS